MPNNLAWLIDALAQLDAALIRRVDRDASVVHRAPPMTGVEVIVPSGNPRPVVGHAAEMHFDPLA